MEKEEYLTLSEVEDTHWWYKSLRRLTLFYLEKAQYKERSAKIVGQIIQPSNAETFNINSHLPLTILDAGCGTGGLLKLSENLEGYKIGLDISMVALDLARRKTKATLVCSSVENLPFKDNSFTIIFSLDVLYHKWIKNDEKVLNEFNRVLQNEGILILNVPAYNFLYSKHDERVFTRERYSKSSILKKLVKSNFHILKINYWNSLLFPFLAFFRLIRKFSRSPHSDVKKESIVINKIMEYTLYIEFLIARIIPPPFGLSIFVVCQKL